MVVLHQPLNKAQGEENIINTATFKSVYKKISKFFYLNDLVKKNLLTEISRKVIINHVPGS